MIVPTLRLGLGLRFPGPGPSFASTAAIIAAGPVYTTDFTALSALPTGVSLSRATTGTDSDASGVLQTAAINAARFDHAWNGSLWVPTGLLGEDQRTNLFLSSNDLSGAAWTNTDTITQNSGVSPDGTTNATRVQISGGGVFSYQSITQTNIPYTLSVWAKSNTGSNQSFRLFGATLASVSSDKVATSVWQRFSFTFTPPAGDNLTGIEANVAGDAADLLFYGFQIEAGSFPTSYIPTTSAAVTRSADIPSSSSPLTGYLAAGPSVWEFQDEATGAIARAAYAAGAFDWPVNKWYRSMGVYSAGTDTSSHMAVGSAY